MLSHEWIVISLLAVLWLFKRTRYAATVYLVPYGLYLVAYSSLIISDKYYFSVSAGLNTVICFALFWGYKFNSISDIFKVHKYNINQVVGLLSVLLIAINCVGYWRWYNNVDIESVIYNSDYRFIVAVQVTLLYMGNLYNAWVDRREHRDYMRRNSVDMGTY